MAAVKLANASGKVTGTHNNIPLLVIPSQVTNIGSLTTAEANSVRTYADAAYVVELAREITSNDEIWFKTGSSYSSASESWMDWDGVRSDYAVTDTYGRNAVWSNYKAVYHLNDVNPSVASGTTLTNENSVTFASSVIDNGSSTGTTNTNKQLNTGTTELISNAQISSGWAVSGWVTFNTLPATSDGDDRWVMCFNASAGGSNRKFISLVYNGRTTNQGFRVRFDGTSVVFYNAGITTTVNTPVYFVMQYTGSNIQLYLNSSSVINSAHTFSNQSFAATARRYQLHMIDTYGAGASSSKIDENRVLIGNYSADWIATEYQNQNDNGAFWVATPVISTTTIKTYLGIATANVKTVLNNTPIANRKSWNGIE